MAIAGLTSNKTVHITIEGVQSGALLSIDITAKANTASVDLEIFVACT